MTHSHDHNHHHPHRPHLDHGHHGGRDGGHRGGHAGGDRGGGVSGYSLAPTMGHNTAERVAQWQEPHHDGAHASVAPEADFDLVEASFTESFPKASDPTSFLRLARVPFVGRTGDGRVLRLLRVECEQVTDVGALVPQLGGESHRHDPLPASLVSTRRRLCFAYFDGQSVVRLSLAETRALLEGET